MLWSDFKIKYAVDRFGEQRLNRQLASNETYLFLLPLKCNYTVVGSRFGRVLHCFRCPFFSSGFEYYKSIPNSFCVTGDLTCFENSLHHLTYG